MGSRFNPSVQSSDLHNLEKVTKQNLSKSAKISVPHAFISFASEDEDHVNLLRGQAKNPSTELRFDDFSLKKAIDSDNETYIKTRIRERIKRASITLVYLTNESAASEWVSWEINESLRQGKSIVGIYQGDAPPSKLPSEFQENSLKVVKWSHEKLDKAIQSELDKKNK